MMMGGGPGRTPIGGEGEGEGGGRGRRARARDKNDFDWVEQLGHGAPSNQLFRGSRPHDASRARGHLVEGRLAVEQVLDRDAALADHAVSRPGEGSEAGACRVVSLEPRVLGGRDVSGELDEHKGF